MDRILGQDRAIDVLQTQLAGERAHHAYIFGGPTGVGKFTTALALARLLLCHQRQRDLSGRLTACGTCPSCQLMPPSPPEDEPPEEAAEADAAADNPTASAGGHPDLHVITKELARYSSVTELRKQKQRNIPIDLLRERLTGGKTRDEKYHEPSIGKAASLEHGRVVIIDEAELLDGPGQNLLLKTLEEPPAGTTLILVTASEDRLLATIRSRCHRIAFVPLPDEAMARWLSRRAPALIERDRQWLVEFAGGSPGRAKLALDYGLTEWAEAVLPPLDRIAQGQPSGALGQEIAKRIDEFAKTWVDRHENASKEAANVLAADLMGALLAARARRRVTELAGQCEPGDPVAGEARLEPWLGVIDAVHRMRELLTSNVNLSLACDHLAVMMTQRLAGTGERG